MNNLGKQTKNLGIQIMTKHKLEKVDAISNIILKKFDNQKW